MAHGSKGRQNEITTEGSTLETYYHKSVLTLEKIDQIATIIDVETIFRVNQDWCKSYGIKISTLKAEDVERCVKIFRKEKMKDLELLDEV